MRHLVLLTLVLALLAPMSASASTLIDRNASGVTLKVSASGQALLSYKARGKQWNVLAWGAVNAIKPTPGGKQVDFRLDYSGGWGTYKRNVWKTLANTCKPYTGPPLAWKVTACTATDGSHWGVQAWQRMLPNYGLNPSPKQAVWELRLSHWTGDLPALTVNTNWAYRKFDHLFGTFAYNGTPVHGFRSTAGGNPLDSFGRNLYVDTFNSAYGSRLEAREQLPHAQEHRNVLLRLLPPRQPARRTRRALSRDDHRPGRDARRDVERRIPRGVRRVPRSRARRHAARHVRQRSSLQGRLTP